MLKTKKSNSYKKDIPVAILCGGKGTRIKEETTLIPKPLVRIGDYPILWHIMKIYHTQGFRRFVLLLGYKGEKIKEYFINYPLLSSSFTLSHKNGKIKIKHHTMPKEDWEITFLDTGLETQTGGRIRQLQGTLKNDDRFLLTYGDGVSDVDIKKTIDSHIKSKKKVTMTGVAPVARFGEIRIGDSGVIGFYEKPNVTNSLINGGFFVVEKSILKNFPEDPMLNFETMIIPKLAESNQLNIVHHDGYWHCMDTLRDMEHLNHEWNSGNPRWKIWE